MANERPTRVLVAGAINTDLVARVRRAPEAGETVTGTEFTIFGGGKGANQAFAVARVGTRVSMLGAVGRDDFGRQRIADLTSEGIDVAGIAMSDFHPSGVALITVEEHGENRIAYVPGATLHIEPERALHALEASAPGVLLTTLELPLRTLTTLYEAAQARGTLRILNATPESSTGQSLLPLVDVLIVNETEALELLGVDSTDWAAAANSLGQLGPAVVIITLGAAGAILWRGGAIERVTAPDVTPVDTTGAGDAFCGAFAARLAANPDDWTGALQWGVAAGSLATTIPGAQPGIPRHDAVAAIIAG